MEENELNIQEAFDIAYRQIKKIAHRQKLRFYSLETLNTTAIVHEAYMKLDKNENPVYKGKTHFCRVAAKAIRHILINYVEQKMALKRGKGIKNEDFSQFEGMISMTHESAERFLSLHEALQELEHFAPRQHQLVEARFFGGMAIEDAADLLDISPATAKRDWTLAKAWLFSRINTKN
ncbi:MAG: ECF-type sigma factor [Bacteroidota bacterium]